MADNITTPAIGATLATDDIGGTHYPRSKMVWGADGVANDVSATNPMPVTIPGTLPVSGNVGITGPVAVTGSFYPATQPISGNVGVTGNVAVTGTFYQAVQPVSGNVGVTGTVAVSGTFWQATQPISAAALPLPAGAATATKQDENKAALDILASAKRWFAITPGTSNLATPPSALYVDAPGALVVRGSDSVDVTFNVVAGQILPIRPVQVRTGTTATVIGLVT